MGQRNPFGQNRAGRSDLQGVGERPIEVGSRFLLVLGEEIARRASSLVSSLAAELSYGSFCSLYGLGDVSLL